MTTERSGMSLEQVSNMLRRSAWDMVNPKYRKKFADAADAIDAHLSRDVVVSDEPACYVSAEHLKELVQYDGTETVLTKETFEGAVPLFTARPAAVPDAKVMPTIHYKGDLVHEAGYVTGWNACREAMLAQRDGGK